MGLEGEPTRLGAFLPLLDIVSIDVGSHEDNKGNADEVRLRLGDSVGFGHVSILIDGIEKVGDRGGVVVYMANKGRAGFVEREVCDVAENFEEIDKDVRDAAFDGAGEAIGKGTEDVGLEHLAELGENGALNVVHFVEEGNLAGVFPFSIELDAGVSVSWCDIWVGHGGAHIGCRTDLGVGRGAHAEADVAFEAAAQVGGHGLEIGERFPLGKLDVAVSGVARDFGEGLMGEEDFSEVGRLSRGRHVY